ncbi:DUF1365 domain-containing protein [Roseibium denhamense]|nr:DUF1365 domain-containing protein [Roseibium denhamense]
MRENGPAPDPALVLYSGSVMHHRMKPAEHRFSYSVFSILVDLDRLKDAARSSMLFSVNRFNFMSLHVKDHGPRDGSDLRAHVEGLLLEKGIPAPHRILMLAYPRLLGYGFNPLTVYYAYDAQNVLTALVYEVRNTFGGQHTYVAPIENGQRTDAGIRQEQDKEFYVSPFIPMKQRYFFRMLPPGRSVRVRILEKDADGPLLSATFAGEQKPATTAQIFRECIRVPLLTFKVMAAIHWEAFKIWRKRVPFVPRRGANVAGGPSQTANLHMPLASNPINNQEVRS